MNNCPHYDYGKSADKALGAYCTKHKKLVEEDGCEWCDKEPQKEVRGGMYADRNWFGQLNRIKEKEE